MINITKDFSPPYKLVIPYFITGVIFYFISIIYTFTIDIEYLNIQDLNLISYIHIFLIGFVMMIIFGAMAQLIPVTFEIGHFCIEFYYLIYPLLLLGLCFLLLGFTINLNIILIGGIFLFLSMSIYLIDTFVTMKKINKFNNITRTIFISNIFLFLGLIIGIMMSLIYSGQLSWEIQSLSKIHIILLIFGYIMLTIIALSLVLIPMFGLSHNFSQKPFNLSIFLLSISIILFSISSLAKFNLLEKISIIMIILALLIYFYQIILIYQSRARKTIDIYYKSLFFSFFCFIISILFFIIFFVFENENLLYSATWLIINGFFGYLIIGHLYKILPFLVWFEKFSPLVGKQKVPMLTDMVCEKSANFQIYFGIIGVCIVSISLLILNNELFNIGISFLIISTVFLIKNTINIIRFK